MRPLQLSNFRQLKREPSAQAVIDGLVRMGHQRLAGAQHQGLTFDGKFCLAYNAAHFFALAALRWHGFWSSCHFTVFQYLEATVRLPAEHLRVLESACRQQNRVDCVSHADVDEMAVEELIRAAREVASRLAELRQSS